MVRWHCKVPTKERSNHSLTVPTCLSACPTGPDARGPGLPQRTPTHSHIHQHHHHRTPAHRHTTLGVIFPQNARELRSRTKCGRDDETQHRLRRNSTPFIMSLLGFRLFSSSLRPAVTGGAKRYAWFGQQMVKDAEAPIMRTATSDATRQMTSYWRAKSYPEFFTPPTRKCAHQTMNRMRASDAFGLHSPWKVHAK